MRLGTTTVPAGTKASVALPVARTLTGGDISLWCHVARGSRPGPTLTLLSTLHGSEWFYIDLLRRFFERLDPLELRGTVVVVPVANPPALSLRARNSPDDGDSPDPNRVFPGGWTWLTDQLVGVLVEEVLGRTSCLLDLHRGAWGAAARHTLVADDLADPAVSLLAEYLALEFGTGVIRRTGIAHQQPGPRSSIGYVGATMGIPGLAVEWGGPGFGEPFESQWLAEVENGLVRVMAALGMWDVAVPAASASQLVYRHGRRANPRSAGLLLPVCGPERLGGEVREGELLGRVLVPDTLEPGEELVAPCDGTLFLVARDYPVMPGEWAFGIAVDDDAARRTGPEELRDDVQGALAEVQAT